MSDKMREAMIDQDGAVWEKIGGAWSLYKPVQSVAVVGEAVAEAYVYEDVDGDDILGLRLLKEDYPMQHGEKLYIEPPTSITQAETHAIELRAYEATVQNLDQRIRQLEKELGEALMEQAVAVTGDPIAILRREIGEDTWFDWKPVLPNSKTHQQLKAAGEMDYCEVYQRYTQSIPASKLAALREKAAEADELRKDAFMWEARYKTLAVLFASVAPTVDEIDDSIRAAMQERQP